MCFTSFPRSKSKAGTAGGEDQVKVRGRWYGGEVRFRTDPLEGFHFYSSEAKVQRRPFHWVADARINGWAHPSLRRVFRRRSRSAVEAAAEAWIESLRLRDAIAAGERFLAESAAVEAASATEVSGGVYPGDSLTLTDTGQTYIAGMPYPDPVSGRWTTPLHPVGDAQSRG